MSIILAQNLVRQGKSVEEAAKIAGVGEEMLRGLLGLPQKEETAINRAKDSESPTGEGKKNKIRVDSDAIKKPKEGAKKEKKAKKRNLISELCEKYPKCFNRQEPKPLKIGIHKDILEQVPEIGTPEELSAAMRGYVRKDEYLEALKTIDMRYDLEGEETEAVSEEHKQDASNWIEMRQRKKEERKKLEERGKEEVSE